MAWSIIGVSNVVETAVTGGNLTLGAPAGTPAVGDLLVACIGYRSTETFTAPVGAGWNLVATQQNSGDTDATSGIASGAMWYKILTTAEDPSYAFTRTGGNVAQGTCIRYRTAASYNTGNAATLAEAGEPSAASLSLTAGNLIVYMVSSGDANSVGAFDAVTDPATASGTGGPQTTPIDATTAPVTGTWTLRVNSTTGTGADHGLAVADAVKTTTAATGTMSAIDSTASTRSVSIVAAFHEGVAPRTASESDDAAATDAVAVKLNFLAASVSDTTEITEGTPDADLIGGTLDPLEVSVSDDAAVTDPGAIWRWGDFDSSRRSIVLNLVSAQGEAAGWNAEVIDALLADLSAVTRFSDVKVRVTIPAVAGFQITASEVITGTVKAACVATSTSDIVASPTVSVLSDVLPAAADSAEITESPTVSLEELPAEDLEAAASDSVEATDTAQAIRDHSLAVSDDVSATDSAAAQLDVLYASLSDVSTAQDSTADQLGFLQLSETDSVAATDAAATMLERLDLSASDSASVTEDRSIVLEGEAAPLSASASDDVTADESTAERLDLLQAAAEDSASVSEGTPTVALEGAAAPLSASLSDVVEASDSTVDALGFLQLSVSDDATASDATADELAFLQAVLSDSAAVTEAVAAWSGGDFQVNVSDSVAATESKDARKISTVFDDAVKSDIILGLISAQSEAMGWNQSVRDALLADLDSVSRVDNEIVRITIPAVPPYEITAPETVTAYIPSSSLDSGVPITGTPTFDVDIFAVVSASDSSDITDSAAVAVEGAAASLQVSLDDAVSTIEAIERLLEGGYLSVSPSDAVAVTDDALTWSEWSEPGEVITAGPLGDTVTVSDSPSVLLEGAAAPLTLAVSDLASAADQAIIALNALLAALQDSVEATDAGSAVIASLNVSAQDEASVSDGVIASSGMLTVLMQDLATVAESVSAQLNVLNVAAQDSTVVSDSTAAEQFGDRFPAASDAASVSESVSVALDVLNVLASDIATITEVAVAAVGIAPPIARAASDSAVVTDQVAVVLDSLNVLAEEAVAVSDAAYAALDVLQVSVQDTAAITEAVGASAYDTWIEINLSDTVRVTEGYPVRTIPDPTKALGWNSTGSAIGHKSKHVDAQ